jgi:hypothetical protein
MEDMMKFDLPEGLNLRDARTRSIGARRNFRTLVRSKKPKSSQDWSDPELRKAINECLVRQTHAAIAARIVQNT